MDTSSIALFAIIGAILMIVVAGGITSMMDEDVTPAVMATGATAGGAIGAALSYFGGGDTKTILSAIGATSPDMKVGLPTF
jgi:membrane protein DedA with SNARE-associated domain